MLFEGKSKKSVRVREIEKGSVLGFIVVFGLIMDSIFLFYDIQKDFIAGESRGGSFSVHCIQR